jgi:hypothetical protein
LLPGWRKRIPDGPSTCPGQFLTDLSGSSDAEADGRTELLLITSQDASKPSREVIVGYAFFLQSNTSCRFGASDSCATVEVESRADYPG